MQHLICIKFLIKLKELFSTGQFTSDYKVLKRYMVRKILKQGIIRFSNMQIRYFKDLCEPCLNAPEKEIEKVSSGKVKYNSLTGKSVIDPTITRFGPYMNKILGINNGNYIDMLLSKKRFHLRLTNCQPLTTYSMASHVTYCILVTSIKTYRLEISFTLSQ